MGFKRTKNLLKANAENNTAFAKATYTGIYPTSWTLARDKKNIKMSLFKPNYIDKAHFLSENNSKVFMEICPKDMPWLDKLGLQVSTKIANSKIKQGFTNYDMDFVNPGMSALRFYDNDTDFNKFTQVQVYPTANVPGLFQLNVHEVIDFKPSTTLILACDLTNQKQVTVDLLDSKKYSLSVAQEKAARIGTIFANAMIYLRIWHYSTKTKSCVLSPLVDLDSKTFPYQFNEPVLEVTGLPIL